MSFCLFYSLWYWTVRYCPFHVNVLWSLFVKTFIVNRLVQFNLAVNHYGVVFNYHFSLFVSFYFEWGTARVHIKYMDSKGFIYSLIQHVLNIDITDAIKGKIWCHYINYMYPTKAYTWIVNDLATVKDSILSVFSILAV